MTTNNREDSEKGSPDTFQDSELWQKVTNYANGSTDEKLKAISIIFGQHRKLPPKWVDIVCKLATEEQPKEVRIALASSFVTSSSLTTKQYFSVLRILSKVPDKEVSRIVDGELTKYKQNDEFFTLFSYEFNKAIEEIRLRERETLLNLVGQRSHVFGQLADSIHKRQQETFGQLSGKDFDPIIGNIGISNLKPIRKILEPIPSYYPVSELSTVETAGQIPADSKALDYVKRLRKCKRGRENWKEYQDLCTEILTYCLVPPLMEPSEQGQNIGARHKRDIIFQIPHGAGKFWDWIVLKFGLGIVVECKNYTDALKENEVVITSKYLGK